MLGLPKQIDVVVKEKGELEWRVVLEVHASEWLRAPALSMLEEKMNAYAAFVLEGQMRVLYPNSTPERTHIVVASVDPIPDKALGFLEHAREVLQPSGVTLSWMADGGMSPEGMPPPRGFDGAGGAADR